MNNQPSFEHKRLTDWLRIKTEYRSQVLRDSALLIRKMQNQVVDDWDLFESGTMKRSLQGHFSVADIDTGAQLSMSYLNYLRFIDMPGPRYHNRQLKKFGYELYNKIIWGYIYRQTMPALKYGLTEDMQQLMRNKVIETMRGSMDNESAMTLIDMSSSGDRNAMAIVAKSLRRGFRI